MSRGFPNEWKDIHRSFIVIGSREVLVSLNRNIGYPFDYGNRKGIM